MRVPNPPMRTRAFIEHSAQAQSVLNPSGGSGSSGEEVGRPPPSRERPKEPHFGTFIGPARHYELFERISFGSVGREDSLPSRRADGPWRPRKDSAPTAPTSIPRISSSASIARRSSLR